MRRILSILILLGLTWGLSAASLNYDVRASFRAGAILPDGKVEPSAGIAKGTWQAPVYSAELAVAFRPDWRALHEWNDASLGVALSYWHLGSKTLGDAIAPYAFLDIPLVRVPHFRMGIRAGVGVSFLTKTYYNTVPADLMYTSLTIPGQTINQSVGSVFNFYFPEAFYMDFPIRDGWAITLGGGWYHMSNGSLRQPNSGYNIFAGELGARYTPPTCSEPRAPWSKNEDSRPKLWELELSFLGGAREVYYKDRQKFFCGEIKAAAFWRAHNIFRLGGGVDVFYDGSYRPRETKFQKTDLSLARANGADCWRLGVSIQPEFVVGAFTAGFHVGAYLLDPVKRLEGRQDNAIFYRYDLLNAGSAGYPDGWLYTEISLKYHLPWHIFIEGAMKAHLTKVEFVGVGIGAWI